MTTALCFHCGETKFGALCPCANCGVGSSGDPNLDILFSDHRMSVATLRNFGDVIKQLAARCADPEIRFWAFISYVSAHPSDLLSATPPEEIAERVKSLLAEARLPIVAADIKPLQQDTGPPQRTVAIPEPLLRAYLDAEGFHGMETIQVRRRDGSIVKGVLFGLDVRPQFALRADVELTPEDIVAMRTAPGCLTGWLWPPRWIEAASRDAG